MKVCYFSDLRHRLEKAKCRKLSKEERKVFFSLAQEFMDNYFLEMVNKEKEARKKSKQETKNAKSETGSKSRKSETKTSSQKSETETKSQTAVPNQKSVPSISKAINQTLAPSTYENVLPDIIMSGTSTRVTNKATSKLGGSPRNLSRNPEVKPKSSRNNTPVSNSEHLSPLQLDLTQDSDEFSPLRMNISQDSDDVSSLRLDLSEESMNRPPSCYSVSDTPSGPQR